MRGARKEPSVNRACVGSHFLMSPYTAIKDAIRRERPIPVVAVLLLASAAIPTAAWAAPTCFGRAATRVGTEVSDEIKGTPMVATTS
jgi:hypothetical protein